MIATTSLDDIRAAAESARQEALRILAVQLGTPDATLESLARSILALAHAVEGLVDQQRDDGR